MIRGLALAALSRPPLYGLLARRALAGGPLTILCYHTLGPDRGGPDGWTVLRESDFRAQVAFLRRHYDIVGLDAALAGQGGQSRRPRAVLTFDDGDAGLHAHLLPILREAALLVTVYVATGQIETATPFWFDRVVNALQGPAPIRIDLTDRGLSVWNLPATPGKARWSVLGNLLETLKAAGPERRDALVAAVLAQAPDSGATTPALGPMSRDQLRDLARTPGVTIGAHSHCHNLLDQIPPDQARDSVARSRALLEDWTGQKVRHFAYPNGNHTAALRAMVAQLGFASATVLGMTTAPAGGDRFALPRFPIGRYDTIDRFRLRLVGI